MRNIRPWCISRQLWWGHRLPVWYCDAVRGDVSSPRRRPSAAARAAASCASDEDVLDTWFSSALWPFAVLGWPDETPELDAFYPTDVLVTAREIIFLWVARMVMMGIEFAGEVPFSDVCINSVIQAPRRAADVEEPRNRHRSDRRDRALRRRRAPLRPAGDVVDPGRPLLGGQDPAGLDLANKLWNASRLILLNAPRGGAGARDPGRVEDRWILSRLQRAIEVVTAHLDGYDFAHAALELYRFFWSELCDWYLEIVKPRLNEGEPEAAATLLWILEQTLALAHPMMPFVTEEIYSYLRSAGDGAPR